MAPFQNPHGADNQDHHDNLGMEVKVETKNYNQRLSKAYSDFRKIMTFLN